MRRLTVVPLLLACLISVACVTTKSNYDRVAAGYVEASIAYEAIMPVLQQVRAEHKITDADWRNIETMQAVLGQNSSQLYALLKTWHATGVEPTNVDLLLQAMQSAINSLQTIATNAQKGASKP